MKPSEADRRRLEHILDHIERIASYVRRGKASFDQDQMAQDAVLRCLSVIGEAAGALSADALIEIPSLPPELPRSQRNLLIHEYWRVDPDIVWATVQQDLPPLGADIRRYLNAG